MKIISIRLERFKRFRDYTLEFYNKVGMPNITVLVGDNGAGKTSILQAIAATLGTATKQINDPAELEWPGFVVDGLSASHRGFSEVTLNMQFEQSELEATQEFYDKSDYPTAPKATRPGNQKELSLIWTTNPDAKYLVSTKPQKASYFYQFQGRRYAYNLLYNRIAEPDMFKKIGGVFWYTEQRTAYTLAPFAPEGVGRNGKSPIKQVQDEESMRRLLTNWFAASRDDKLERFNEYYGRLFPGRRLSRIGDTYGASTTPIYFYDGHHDYDISELSGGERALMPLLLDFVEWGINNSVILIDELELHLHPPLQQALLALLPQLGHNNQFILTTHSDSVANLVPTDAIQRIEEG
jgi:predicted ATPase